VPPGPLENYWANWPIASSSKTPSVPPSGATGIPPISLTLKWSQPPAELGNADVTDIVDLPPMPATSYNDSDEDDESDYCSDSGGRKGKLPISLQQTKFSLKQFANRMGLLDKSALNKWKNIAVAGYLEKRHWCMMRGQNSVNHIREEPLHQVTEVADVLQIFPDWLPLVKCHNAEWIRQYWLRYLGRNVHAKLRRRGIMQGKATSDGQWIWESTWGTPQYGFSQRCQIQLS